ncbi:MAG: carboxypeptidase regulatory-like domain-containing protein [Pyrinomonadaceae bacterium]
MLRKFLPLISKILILAAALLLITANVFAQSQATSGNIEGRVLDPNGAVVPNATVTATNPQTGFEKTATTDGEGNYRIVLLPPGTYTVRTAAPGFESPSLSAEVTVGGVTPLDVTLGVQGVATNQLTITAEAPVVETGRTSVATTINQRAIENLPINGRNFQDFATLTPGVIRDPTRTGDLSVGGLRGTLNSVQVDGVDNNNTFFGQSFGRGGVRPPYQFSEESVQEFQVNQNGFSAEFGRAGGAVINVVTRSGTNQFHGGGFEYFRDESLNSNTPDLKGLQARRGLPNRRPKSQINQFGARLGGPIKQNRAFFFFTYDGQRQTLPNFIDPPNFFTQSAAIQNLLLPRLNTYSLARNQDVFLAKGDIALNQNNQLSLRFNNQRFTGTNNENGGSLSTEEHSGDSLVRSNTFSGTLASTLSTKVVNEFRFQFARDREPGEANSDRPEALIDTGAGNLALGRNNFSPRETTIRRAQFIDNVSYISGRSSYKFGVDFNFDRVLNFFPGLFSGSYTFGRTGTTSGYQNFLNNAPTAYTQNFAGAGTSGGTTNPNNSDYAAFAQDDLRLTQKLTLNLGVRYDYQNLACPPVRNPDPALLSAGYDTARCPKDGNNIAPRVGFSYGFNEKTVVRGGYGIFYARTPTIVVGTAHSQNGINVTGINLRNAAAIAAAGLVYPNILTAPPAGAVANPNLFLFADNYVQPYVQQARLGFEREILPNLSLSATYLLYRGVHLTRTRDVNLAPPVPTSVAAPDGQTFTFQRFPTARPLTRYNRINLFESNANSIYHGLAVQAVRRFSRGFQFTAAYTYSKARDDKPDQTAVVVGADDSKIAQNQLDTRADFAAADTDLRHRFVFSPVYETGKFKYSDNPIARALFSDYTFSGVIQFQSGFAYSAFVAGDPNNDGNRANDRLPGTARNSFYTPSVYQFDARITRAIHTSETTRLRLILEGFNIFNHPNVASVNTTNLTFATATGGGFTLTAPSAATAFGTPRSFSTQSPFLSPRQIQLAVKFDF